MSRTKCVQILTTKIFLCDVTQKERDDKMWSTLVFARALLKCSLSLSLPLSSYISLYSTTRDYCVTYYLCVEVLSLRLEEEFWKLFAFGFRGAFVERERVDDALGELSQRVSRGVKSFVQVRCTRVFLVVLQQAF